MKISAIFSKFSVSITACTTLTFAYLALSATDAHAGYLIPPVPGPFVECVNCCTNCAVKTYKHKPKKHYKKIHHYKKYKHYKYYRYVPCNYYYKVCEAPIIIMPCSGAAQGCYRANTHDFVEFNTSPDAYGSGKYVINTYDNYDPDMATGDDDPTTYPGMDIDR